MSDAALWIVIVGLTLVTIGTRSFLLVLGERFPLPERVQHALRYAPVCALAALIAPELVLQQGQLSFDLRNFKLLAGLAAAAVMLLTRSMMVTMAAGMAVYWALRLA